VARLVSAPAQRFEAPREGRAGVMLATPDGRVGAGRNGPVRRQRRRGTPFTLPSITGRVHAFGARRLFVSHPTHARKPNVEASCS